MRLVAGVDIGGSSVKVGILNVNDGMILSRDQLPIEAHDQSPERVVELTSKLFFQLLENLDKRKTEIQCLAIACPGQLVDHGVIHAAANFPTWCDVPLQELFENALELPVFMCNDADAAILAEQWVGSAKHGVTDFIMLTLGTGVGCGVVVGGNLLRGATNTIEGGHLIVERNGRLCGCSQRGCLEAYSSASALVLEAQEHLLAGADSMLSTYNLQDINAKLIFDMAANGDAMCIRLIEEAADYLGFACVSMSRLLDPQMIVLSGGMAEAGTIFIDRVRTAYKKYAWKKFPNPVTIAKASAGYDSGIIGAAAIARSLLQQQ